VLRVRLKLELGLGWADVCDGNFRERESVGGNVPHSGLWLRRVADPDGKHENCTGEQVLVGNEHSSVTMETYYYGRRCAHVLVGAHQRVATRLLPAFGPRSYTRLSASVNVVSQFERRRVHLADVLRPWRHSYRCCEINRAE